MTALADILKRQIRQSGPLNVAEYMAACLSHPEHGYYMTRDPFGVRGDFTTAPEISQMFGELLGLWLAQVWVDQGRPSRFVLAELGPGRGTLMADILRATRGVSGFGEAAQVWLVETSPVLREVQKATLEGIDPNWADAVGELPSGPVFVVANEFFDALPVRQFVREGSGWCERLVGSESDELTFGLAPATSMPMLDARHAEVEDGEIAEVSPVTEAIAGELGARIAGDGGVALVIDYGDWHGLGDTLQALRSHQMVSPLATPGEADLTAHVNFSALATALRPARVTPMLTQGRFLELLGLTGRANALASGERAREITSQHRRLTHPDEMGNLFKVIAASDENVPLLPGFV